MSAYAEIPPIAPEHAQALFAGGCFWCMQPPFDATPGVVDTVVGYSGGSLPRPSYQQVCQGSTGHLESILVIYDPQQVTYSQLLEVFWRSIDPTQSDGQFADRGEHYLSAIFVSDPPQRASAEESKQALERSGIFAAPIATKILDAGPFYPAEEYHQHYYRKNSGHYQAYKEGSGRGPFLRHTWQS